MPRLTSLHPFPFTYNGAIFFGQVTHHVSSLLTGPVCPVSFYPIVVCLSFVSASGVLSFVYRTVFSSQHAILEAARNFPFSF